MAQIPAPTANVEPLVRLAQLRAALRSGTARRIRVNAEVGVGELAEAIGVSPATLSRWEHGARVPRGEAALRYSEVLQALGKAADDPTLEAS